MTIVAWRTWRLRTDVDRDVVEPILESCVYGDEWPTQKAFSAECSQHRRPVPDCGCGIYAVTTREATLEWALWAQSALPNPIVLGRVQLWGLVLPHSVGYLAELAYPYELEVLAGDRLDETKAQAMARRLRDLYVVDIVQRAA